MGIFPTWGKKCVQNICITSSEETTRKNKEEIKIILQKDLGRTGFLEAKVGESVWVRVQWRDLEVNFDYR
jgi:hypothetical protein